MSIDQTAVQKFRSNFFEKAQQTESHLSNTGVIDFEAADAKISNFGRMSGKLELVEVKGRNPDKQYIDYNTDNRKLKTAQYTATLLVDSKTDVDEAIANPTAQLMNQLIYARNRLIDRVAINSAVGDVLVGSSEEAGTLISATADGVKEIDATSSGFSYDVINRINENYINNDLIQEAMDGSVACITGMEHFDLMGEPEFKSNLYTHNYAVEKGFQTSAEQYGIVLFAGSNKSAAGYEVINPILPEVGTTRKCVVMTKHSLVMQVALDVLKVGEAASKVNSKEVHIALRVGGFRTEGARVQIVKTTF